MKKRKAFAWYDPIHHIDYYFCVGDWDRFDKECKRHGVDNSNSSREARCVFVSDGKRRKVFIFLNRINTPALAHEASHAAIAVFTDIGSRVNHETEEHFAYYIQWIIGTIMVTCGIDIDKVKK
jgi:hypothetical protein